MKPLSFAFFVTLYIVFTYINGDIKTVYVNRASNARFVLFKNREDNKTLPPVSVLLNRTLIKENGKPVDDGVERARKCLNDVDTCLQEDDVYTITSNRISKFLFSAAPPLDLTSVASTQKCKQDSQQYLDDLKKFKLWALRMYDANAKLPSGILNGNVNQYGDFDLCLTARLPEEDIRGKYCLASMQMEIPKSPYLSGLHKLIQSHYAFRSTLNDPGHRVPRFSSMNWALCVPASCSSEDVKNGFEKSLRTVLKGTEIDLTLEVDHSMCQTDKDDSLQTSTVIVGTIFITFILFIVTATIYDYNVSSKKNEYLTAFSLWKNARTLVSTSRSPNDIKSVHGIRFLNAVMLVLAHKCMASFFTPYINRTAMGEHVGQPWTVLGRNASLYTDPFIMLSGLLTAYSLLGQLERWKRINIFQEYSSRLLRIVPPLGAMILFCTFILPFLSSGPLWNLVITQHSDICKKYWWRNLLFIHNYFGFKNMCLTHTHHLGIDTQLFLLSPLMVISIWKWPKKGTIALAAVAVFSTFLRYYDTHVRRLSNYVHFGTSIHQLFQTADYMYILPSHRITVYIIGVFLAYVLRKQKTISLTKLQLQVGNNVAVFSFLIAFFGPASMGKIDYVYNRTHAAFYAAFAPILWCFTFGWIIFTSHNGYDGFLGKLFSHRIFLIWTRISYSIYLTQFPVFFYNVGTTKNAKYYTFFPTLFNVWEFVSIVAASVVLTLLFEMPFQNLKSAIFKSKKQNVSVKAHLNKEVKIS